MEFNAKRQILTISFKDRCRLIIECPSDILYTESYLKIVKAKEICWRIQMDSNSIHYYNCLNLDHEIKTESNTRWKAHANDIGVGIQALYLQG